MKSLLLAAALASGNPELGLSADAARVHTVICDEGTSVLATLYNFRSGVTGAPYTAQLLTVESAGSGQRLVVLYLPGRSVNLILEERRYVALSDTERDIAIAVFAPNLHLLLQEEENDCLFIAE